MPPVPVRGENGPPLRVLYVSYLGLDDPLVHTQVVAYLAGLTRLGHTVHLLTFETRRLTRSSRRDIRSDMAREGIVWHGLRYHKRPSLLATTFDVASGAAYAAWLLWHHQLEALHARSYVPAAMALIARQLVRFQLIFDIRGLMAEENEDAGRWRRDSVAFRLTKWVERRALERAAAVIVLTRRLRDYLFSSPARKNVHVIPCCAEINGIQVERARRAEMRRRLAVNDRVVLVYVGKFTGWYMEREMVEFFALAREQRPDMHFLILTQSDPKPIEREFVRLGINSFSRTITQCAPSDVGKYLAAADAAIAFIRPTFSKISSSPTKIGEYLAAGLPMVCISGIGDVDELVNAYRVGVLLDGWDSAELARGVEELLELMADERLAERARRAAEENLSLTGRGIPAYDAAYRGLRRR